MEKDKEVFRKACSDVYESKKLAVSKTDHFTNDAHKSQRADATKKSYTSRSKIVHSALEKKSGFYSSESKAFFSTCDKCGIKIEPSLIANAGDHSADTKSKVSHDLNGNISFDVHQLTCNACSVAEISNINKVLNCHSDKHNELPVSKCGKTKQRPVFSEQKTYCSKISNNSGTSVSISKLSQTVANSSTQCHCSKNISSRTLDSDLCCKVSNNRAVSENVTVSDRCNSKYEAKAVSNPLSKDIIKVSELPVLQHSNLPKDTCTSSDVSCSTDKFQIVKQRKRLSKKWNKIPFPELSIDLVTSVDSEKMIFPALPSNSHNQQMKLISSRAGSMPPSEHSSAENSDLESVHSLPGGTIPSALSTSISSTIPQASYADVIRMSNSSASLQNFVAVDCGKISEQNAGPITVQDKLQKDENSQSGSSDWVISRLSQLDQNSSNIVNISSNQSNQNGQNFVAPRPIVVSLEKPSFYNSSLQTNKNMTNTVTCHVNLPSSDQKAVDSENLITDCLCDLEKMSVDTTCSLPGTAHTCVSELAGVANMQGANIKTDSVYSSPSSISSLSDAFKSTENKVVNADNLTKEPPVIIMNCYLPVETMSEISFGIEYEEMLKLCADTCDVSINNASSTRLQDSHDFCFSEGSDKTDIDVESSKAHVLKETSSAEIIIEPESDTAAVKLSINGRKLHWVAPDVDVGRSNHAELAEYFACLWSDVEKEYNKESDISKNVAYFHEL